MLNKEEMKFVEALNNAQRYVKGELELNCTDGDWYALDYRENLGGAFPIENSFYQIPIISNIEAKLRNINIVKCCDFCKIAYVG